MGDLSKHFNRSEFSCKCGCGFDTVDSELLDVIQDLRYYFNTPIKINSGCRCAEHNLYVGGRRKSKHLIGRAADVVVLGVRPEEVQKYLVSKYKGKYGIGCYKNFTHIDTRATGWRG